MDDPAEKRKLYLAAKNEELREVASALLSIGGTEQGAVLARWLRRFLYTGVVAEEDKFTYINEGKRTLAVAILSLGLDTQITQETRRAS